MSVFNSYQAIEDIISLANSEEEANKQISKLNEQKSILEKRLDVVNSDLFVEREARTRLNMKKEGEEVYIVPTSTSSTDSQKDDNQKFLESTNVLGSNTYKEIEEKSNFQRWLEVLF